MGETVQQGRPEIAPVAPAILVVLDVMLPGIDGLEVARRLRSGESSGIPILMLTAREGLDDRTEGLDSGADDYLAKPFGFLELTARMEAVLRRSGAIEERRYGFGPITVDFRRREAERDGERVPLSAREFELLAYLIAHRGEVLTRQHLLEAVWGYHGGFNTRTVDMHVAKLRKKLEEDPARPLWIITQHRVGYRFDG